MYWQQRFERIDDKDREIEQEILQIRKENPNYGYKRIHAKLRETMRINKKRTYRVYKKLELQITKKSSYKKYNSYRGVVGKIAPDRIARRFESTIPYQKITTDTTEFKYYYAGSNGKLQVGKLYLDPYMDMFNREIVSFKISHQPNKESVMEGLLEAIEKTSPCKYRRTFHSDRGWAYQMADYQQVLKDKGIFQSMSRKGNCYDNSVMESFFAVLKKEIYENIVYRNYEELEVRIIEYIKYYNEIRIKQDLGWLSPVQYRQLSA